MLKKRVLKTSLKSLNDTLSKVYDCSRKVGNNSDISNKMAERNCIFVFFALASCDPINSLETLVRRECRQYHRICRSRVLIISYYHCYYKKRHL